MFAGGTILMPEIARGPAQAGSARCMLHRSGLDELSRRRRRRPDRRDGARRRARRRRTGCSRGSRGRSATPRCAGSATVGGNLCASAGPRRAARRSRRAADRARRAGPLDRQGRRAHRAGRGLPRRRPNGPARARGRVRPPGGRRAARRRMRRRHAHSYAIANVAVCSTGDGLRVGVSGVGPTAVRCRAVEQSRQRRGRAEGRRPGRRRASPRPTYRRKMLPVLVRRALDELESA